jgi:diguanylate cyclase (GGDEF)-like protein
MDVLRDALAPVLHAVTAETDPTAAVDAALDAFEAAGEGARWSVFLLDHERLWAVSQRGYTMIPDGLTLDRGVIARAVRTREAQYLPDVDADPDYVVGARGMRSELALPIEGGDGVLGALNLETPFVLDPSVVDELTPVADALAVPLAALRAAPAVDLSSLARLFVHMSSLRDAGEIAALAARSLAHVLGLEACEVTLSDDPSASPVAAWSRTGETGPLGPAVAEALRAHADDASVFDIVDVEDAGLGDVAQGCRTLVRLPLRVNGVEVGVLVGAARGALTFPRRQAEAAALLAAQSAASLDAALALVRERRSASTDPLTGLLNRRGFGDSLEAALERAGTEREPLSLCVLDCDDFKAINDRGGHERGDRVLVELGELIGEALRPEDRAARLGGDEFALMLADTDAGAAQARAEELRAVLARGLTEAGTTVQVSIGVATYPFDGGSATQLLRAADQALYLAKSSGKDLVVAFRDLGEWTRRGAGARSQDRRTRVRPLGAADAESGVQAVLAESSPRDVLFVLCRSLTASLAATAAAASLLVAEDRLIDVATYALRDIDLGTESAYLLDDFPLTRDVLRRREPLAISFLDDRIDRAEAFILRELGMSSLLMMPLLAAERPLGLVEVYDVRLRLFEDADIAVARLLVDAASLRLEHLAAEGVRLETGEGAAAPVHRPSRLGSSSGDEELRDLT